MHERVPNSAQAASAIAAQHCTAQQPGAGRSQRCRFGVDYFFGLQVRFVEMPRVRFVPVEMAPAEAPRPKALPERCAGSSIMACDGYVSVEGVSS